MASTPTEDLARADGSPLHVLVVGDEQMLADLLVSALRCEGREVTTTGAGIAAVCSTQEVDSDVTVLNITLSDLDGLGVIRRTHGHHPDVPIPFLTAKGAAEDRVAGLATGGDGYVTKPFSLEEVMARLRALLRRSRVGGEKPVSVLGVEDLRMDEGSHEVRCGGDGIQLTATEFEPLRYLMRNPRRVLSKPQTLGRVWNYDFGGQVNIVELYISYLRRKIGKGYEPMIRVIRGAGYVLKPAASTDECG